MPSFEFTSPEGKKYTVAGPDGATKEQAFQILQSQIAGGTAQAAAPVADPRMAGVPGYDSTGLPAVKPTAPADPTFVQKLIGGGETALALATGATSGAVGMLAGGAAGLVGNLTDGRYGMKDGVEAGMQQGAESLTYSPRTEAGQDYTQAAGEALNSVSGVLPMVGEMAALGRGAGNVAKGARDLAAPKVAAYSQAAAKSAAAQGAADATMAAGGGKLSDLLKSPKATLPGVGAAETSKIALRAKRFDDLGLKPTLGQLTRDKTQMKFEQEIAKQPEGADVSRHFAEQNEQLQNKFNEFADETGAVATDLRDIGTSVDSALASKNDFQMSGIRQKYDEARAAGEMAAPIDVTNLQNFIKVNKGKDKLAPIISMIESELEQNAQVVGGGMNKLTMNQEPSRLVMTLDASEDLRQAINKLAEPGTPNKAMGTTAIRLIDKATDGQGGAIYKEARRAYENHMKEFSDRGFIDKAMRTKPNSTDAAVAPEGMFQHLILNAPGKDQVSHVFRVLEAHPLGTPPEVVAAGQQAAQNLRGALVEHIKDKIFSNGGGDELGNVVGSQNKAKDIITQLDRKGILKAALGREGAQKLRDLRDATMDIYTTPSGVVNTSNNAPAIVKAIDAIGNSPLRAVPILGRGVKYVTKESSDYVRERHTAKKIQKALNPEQSVQSRSNKF